MAARARQPGAHATGRTRCTSSLLPSLLLLLSLASCAQAFQLGPKPTKPLGVVVQVAAPTDGRIKAAAAALAGILDPSQPAPKPIDPSLNLFTVQPGEGKTAEETAAELNAQPGVVYAYVDEYVSIAGGIPWEERPEDDSSGGSLTGSRKLAAAATGAAVQKKPAPPPLVKRTPAVNKAPVRPSPPPLVRRPPPPPPPSPPPPLVPRPTAPAGVTPTTPTTKKVVPKDAYYKYQWALPNMRAPQAWAVGGTDASSVLVCIVDTGVKFDHPDLVRNLVATDAAYKAKHTDDNGHGTHVAGIVGAVGNNKGGTAGTAFKAKMLACKALDSNGWGTISDVIACITLCRSKGAKVINTSFVLTEKNVPLMEAVGNGTAAGVFFSGAAGNAENDNDAYNFYPGGFDFPGNVAVANVANGDGLGYMSNWGATTVQVAAPGTDILSTWISRDFESQYYSYETGTSMAAPYVSGAAALAMHVSGGALTNADVASLLVSTSRKVPALHGKVVANGVINLEKLIIQALAAKKKALPAKG